MEVESRVSVQAMRGKFEQKPEDSLRTPSPALRPTTPPGRARASSLIIKPKYSNCDKTSLGERLANSVDKENDCSSAITPKHSPGSVSKTKSIFSEVSKALSPKRHSVSKPHKNSSEVSRTTDESLRAAPSRKISENSSAETKPSVVRRIPVFRTFNGVSSDEKTGIKKESVESNSETPCRKDKFLGHIRSRSHGNFMIKRDPSVERNGGFTNKQENKGTSESGSTNFLARQFKQKSSDNLFGHRDSKCSSPFEGKQKIVANVVKNMKNKEKPKVLRKLSFSSKFEKDLKNIKEKGTPNKTTKDKTATPSATQSSAKSESVSQSIVNERRLSFTGSPVGVFTVSVAKEVADIALEKCSGKSPKPIDDSVSPEETNPPSRPPRRRSTTSGLSSHKKGMAPSPPGHAVLRNENKNVNDDISFDCRDSIPVTPPELRVPMGSEKRTLQVSTSICKSSDSIISPVISDTSHGDSPIMISQSSLWLQKPKSKSSVNISDVDKYSEGYCTCDEEKDSSPLLKPGDISAEMEDPTQQDIELLPAGPPPKKPPRTFAYDIYRSGKECRKEDNIKQKEIAETKEDPNAINSPPGPIYAIPHKKKKAENKLIPKPPIRSNSDLTKRDLPKPSVAPKPTHIVNKVKRASVVDPLSCAEKGEEAAITSEFQRQAHIRYSLRRPNKPPPAPPPNSECKGSNINGNVIDSQHLTKSYTALDKSPSPNNDCGSGSMPQLLNVSRYSPAQSGDMSTDSLCSPDFIYQSVTSDDTEDGDSNSPTIRVTSRSSYNLHRPAVFEGNQPLSLDYCPTDNYSDLTGLYRKRSMSDETLYKGSKYGDEPIYAMPIFANGKGSRNHNRQRELHYMCSVLFTDEESDAGRDGGSGRRNSRDGDASDGNKVKSSIISAWKREFRQSCRQVQNKLKKTVNR